jgi:tRNA (cmo5U34)-methyltransferase
VTNLKDTIFSTKQNSLSPFKFDESVVAVFPDMIERSVPGYQTIMAGIGEFTEQFCQKNSTCYDLGCSLGAATLTIRRHAKEGCKIVAVDTSVAMISRAKEHIDGFHSDIPVSLICTDMTELPIDNASVVVINFTLQFISPQQRQKLINKIYQGLLPGGILIVSEKLHFENNSIQSAIEHMHLQFKRNNGYSELEISQKRASLENVLVSDSEQTHLKRFAQAGFDSASIWFQAYNFASFIAIK